MPDWVVCPGQAVHPVPAWPLGAASSRRVRAALVHTSEAALRRAWLTSSKRSCPATLDSGGGLPRLVPTLRPIGRWGSGGRAAEPTHLLGVSGERKRWMGRRLCRRGPTPHRSPAKLSSASCGGRCRYATGPVPLGQEASAFPVVSTAPWPRLRRGHGAHQANPPYLSLSPKRTGSVVGCNGLVLLNPKLRETLRRLREKLPTRDASDPTYPN